VEKNRGWIARTRARMQAQQEEKPLRQFRDGEMLLFLGERHRLSFVDGWETPRRENGELRLGRELSARAEELLRTWYRARAREVIGERLKAYALFAGLRYESVRITDARRRWGSCGPGGSLNFAWRLVMSPVHIIDYVVVHELAHLVESNHSRRFWACVGRILPDYRLRRVWLKENGHMLDL
jgi:hypothetical protein